MNQERQDRIVASGTDRDADELVHRVLDEHPDARELDKIAAAQDGTGHRLWLDETAGALLFLEREEPGASTAERLRLHRIPVRSASCLRVVADMTAPVLARLARPASSYSARSEADRDIGALVQLFRVQLARLRTEYHDRAELVKAIHAQIERADDKEQVDRRTAFLGWFLERVYGYRSGVCPEAAEDLGDGIDTEAGTHLDLDYFDRTIGKWEWYRYLIRAEVRLPDLESIPWKRLGPGDLHWYYEFRTLGRRLTEQQMLELRAALPWAEVTPDALVLDQWSNLHEHPIVNQGSKIMAQYFDAGLRFDQSGTRSLWLRVPATLADQIAPFKHILAVDVQANGDDLSLELSRWEDDGDYAHYDPRPWLQELLPLRDAVARGDVRAVAIAWRAQVNREWGPWRTPADKWAMWLPLPDGLDEDELTPELHALVRLLEETP